MISFYLLIYHVIKKYNIKAKKNPLFQSCRDKPLKNYSSPSCLQNHNHSYPLLFLYLKNIFIFFNNLKGLISKILLKK